MLFALDRINNDMSLLPNLTIGYDVRDTRNNEFDAISEAIDFFQYRSLISNSTPAFLGIVGPAYTSVTHQVATLLSVDVFQIPLISYASSDAALSNKDLYANLLRTIPSDNLQANAMVDLLSDFGWKYVSVIFNDNDYGNSLSNAFIDGAGQHSICLDDKIDIPPQGAGLNKTLVKACSCKNITELNSICCCCIYR